MFPQLNLKAAIEISSQICFLFSGNVFNVFSGNSVEDHRLKAYISSAKDHAEITELNIRFS